VYEYEGSYRFFYSSAFPTLKQVLVRLSLNPWKLSGRGIASLNLRHAGILTFEGERVDAPKGSLTPLPFVQVEGLFESAFCPGYLRVGPDSHLLMVAVSNYSMGHPFAQGLAASFSDRLPHFWKEPVSLNLLLGSSDMPGFRGQSFAFDSPDLVMNDHDTAMVYFSAMSRLDQRWEIFASDLKMRS
jgi:hypothetical protein